MHGLKYRFQRVKRDDGNIEDVYDGALYQKEFKPGGFDSSQNHTTSLSSLTLMVWQYFIHRSLESGHCFFLSMNSHQQWGKWNKNIYVTQTYTVLSMWPDTCQSWGRYSVVSVWVHFTVFKSHSPRPSFIQVALQYNFELSHCNNTQIRIYM